MELEEYNGSGQSRRLKRLPSPSKGLTPKRSSCRISERREGEAPGRCMQSETMLVFSKRQIPGEACTGLVETGARPSSATPPMTVHMIKVGCRESWQLRDWIEEGGIPHL